MMSYLFQGWNSRAPQKYRDMLLDIGTEEIGHVEMLSVMIVRLHEGAPPNEQEDAAKNPMGGTAMNGMDVRDVMTGMLSINLAHDIMHQNQWAAAIEELKADGLEDFIVPGTMPLDRVRMDQAHVFWNHSQGKESREGRWAKKQTPDGLGEFEYLANPKPLSSDQGSLPTGDPRLHGTSKQPTPPSSTVSSPNPVNGQNGGGGGGKIVEKITS